MMTRNPYKVSPAGASEGFFWRISTGVTSVIVGVIIVLSSFTPETVSVLLVKDFPGGAGAIEQFTELFLFLALAITVPIFFRYRSRIPRSEIRLWISGWLLATFYFLGEEMSWGQWWFEWETPDLWAEYNEQQETNLHNTSSWLSEKPKLLLELFMYFGSLGVFWKFPEWHQGSGLRHPWNTYMRWVLPGKACIPPALLLLWCRLCTFLPENLRLFRFFADGEMREMAMALFFFWYVAGLGRKLFVLPPSIHSSSFVKPQMGGVVRRTG